MGNTPFNRFHNHSITSDIGSDLSVVPHMPLQIPYHMPMQMPTQNQMQPQFEQACPDPSLILPPYLYLGGSFLNRNPTAAGYIGITHILNMAVELTPNLELFNSRKIKYKHIPADDSLYYNIRFHFEEAFELIDDARFTNGKILVHCAMGISRSATIVIAYIMSRYKVPLRTAYEFVRSRRPEVRPNPLFYRILEEYERELLQNEQLEEIKNKKRKQLQTLSTVSRSSSSLPQQLAATNIAQNRSYSYLNGATSNRREYPYQI